MNCRNPNANAMNKMNIVTVTGNATSSSRSSSLSHRLLVVSSILLVFLSLATPCASKSLRASSDGKINQFTTTTTTTTAAALDHVSMTKEAAELRAQHLSKKRPLLSKKSDSLQGLLFPGMSPEEYIAGDRVNAFVELVESRKTQLPVNYFQIPNVCKAPSKDDTIVKDATASIKKKNLGQRLMSSQGTSLVNYEFEVLRNTTCTVLCSSDIKEKKEMKFLRRLIEKQYRVHFTLDSLPIVIRSKSHNYAMRGFPIGFIDKEDEAHPYYLYNHLKFIIYYNDGDEGRLTPDGPSVQITGFDAVPVSIQHTDGECKAQKNTLVNKKETFLKIPEKKMEGIVYSYEVQWIKSSVQWANRWDVYLMEAPDNEVHYFAIVNSLMIGFLLTSAVAVIMLRALKKDIAKYNDLMDDANDIIMEETGWKLVHGDVFRPPVKGRSILSAAVGTGLQIGMSVFLTLVFLSLRMINPMKKGQTLSYVVILYILSGSVSGYASARLYKFHAGKAWKRATLLTAAGFPGILFTLFVLLNFFLHLSLGKASVAVSFWTMLLMFVLWICVSSPLVFLGAFFGFKADKITVPTKTTQIARFVPETHSWFVKFPHCSLMAGVLPFASVVIELSFIMNALWINQIYYIVGFITIVIFVFTLSCSTMSMVMCYCQLCNEDYKWWWKSFYNGASCGFYLFLYSVWYLFVHLELVGFLSVMLYISYMGLICFAFGLYCGGIGLFSSFWFCRKIYGAVKVD
jgi:transmembrane 9 superfamily protein 2/4